ncbi:pentatricopeptide repeat-containing protein At2g17210-like [Carex rostrata]
MNLLHHYRHARATGLSFTIPPELLPSIFKSLAAVQWLDHGMCLHADAIKTGLQLFPSTSNSITSFYLKSNMFASAFTQFNSSVNKNSVSWNALIHGFMSNGDYLNGLSHWKEARVCDFFKPNLSTLVVSIQACWKLQEYKEGLNLHGYVLKIGFIRDLSVANSLLTMYGKIQELICAQKLFDEMLKIDVISWSALISAYAQTDHAVNAILLFRNMFNGAFVDLDGLSVVSVIQACCNIGNMCNGTMLHGLVVSWGFENDVFVANSLIDMYSKSFDMESAYKVFVQMPERNLVSWNSIFSGLVHAERCVEALTMFDSMINCGIRGDDVTLVSLLQLCKKQKQPMWCKCVHAVIIRRVRFSNIILMNSLLDAYAKCDLMELALQLFDNMEERNLFTWNTMVSGFASCGKPNEAITFFVEAQRELGSPNSVTMLGLLEACVCLAEVIFSNCAHGMAVKNGFINGLAVGTGLVDAYGKCGDLVSAREVFDEMPKRNILTYNAMIGALGMNGRGMESLTLLEEMKSNGLEPNGVTVLTVLSACSHAGLVKEGLAFFDKMVNEISFQPQMEHYSCVVDMLGRAGDLKGAISFIEKLPETVQANAPAWGALLSACRSYEDCEVGPEAVTRVIQLEPSNSAGYLMASNMYAKHGLVDETAKLRSLIREKGMKVMSGYSSVHIGQEAHNFVSHDGSHPESTEMYEFGSSPVP